MKIRQRLFDEVLVLEPAARTDICGSMTDLSPDQIREAVPQADWKVQRIYTMPERHTFFGIHFQKEPYPQAKLISVLQGKGLDYVVDLRKGSATCAQWQALGLDAADPVFVYIPSGFGHAFLSLEENTIQYFAADREFVRGYSGSINWKDPEIALELPCEDPVLSDKDRLAPFLKAIGK